MAFFNNGTYYEDTGCKLYPRCLTCPFPDCQVDWRDVQTGTGKIRSQHSEANKVRAKELRAAGKSVSAIAKMLGLSTWTISEYLKEKDNV